MTAFDIGDVADLLGIKRLEHGYGGEFKVVCPFCADSRGKMYFCIRKNGETKNTYQCFNCGASGNMLTLYAELHGIYGKERYKEAYRRIREELSGQCRDYGIIHGKETKKCELQKIVEKAGRIETDHTYKSLLSLLSLSDAHEKKLRERGLSRAQIEKLGARSVPVDDRMRYARMLVHQGCTVRGIPGFYKNHRKDWAIAFPKKSGIMFPIPDRDGLYAGIQIRMDQIKDGRKYLWLSSAGYPEGISCGSPAAFFGDMDITELNVTEGGLKAYCAHCLSGKSFIGIPGVTQTKCLETFFREKAGEGKVCVRECMDMDKFMDIRCDKDEKCCDRCEIAADGQDGRICPKKLTKRTNIREGCNKLYKLCERYGITCKRVKWNIGGNGIWNGKSKGIDDYYYAKILQNTEKGEA